MSSKRPAGRLIGKIPHDKCGSSDALAVYEHEDGKVDGYCWSCDSYEPNPYGDSQEQNNRGNARMSYTPQLTVTQIFAYQCRGLPHRGLRDDIANYYGIRVGLSQSDANTITHIYYPYVKHGTVTAYKERRVSDKKFTAIGDMKNTELFGQLQAKATGAKRLYVTEGEDDCMILFQALLDNSKGTKWEAFLPAVVSVPSGAGSAVKALSEQAQFIDSFDEIILVMDNDEAGENGVDKALQILPLQKTKIAKLSMKDPCEMYSAGKQVELVKIVLWKTQAPKIASVATARDIKNDAKTAPAWGHPWPWKSLTQLTYGLRDQSIIGIGAGVGVGKSSFWHQTQEVLLFSEGAKCGLFMLEEPNRVTLKKLASKHTGIDFTNPEGHFTQEQLDAAIDKIPDDLCIYRHRGTKDWADVKLAIKHMVLVEGVKFIFIDPLTALVAHLSSSEANDELNHIFGELAGMIEDLEFTVLYGAHLNPPKTGPSHEEGGRVLLAQFTGSKAMIKWSHLIFGLERNTQAESILERNTATLRLLKDRDFGRSGERVILHYDANSGRLLEQTVRVTDPTTNGHEVRY